MLPPLIKTKAQQPPRQIIRGDGQTIKVQTTPGAVTISAIRQAGKGNTSGGSGYAGPWAVTQKDATTTTVKAYDATNGFFSKSLLIAGLTTKEQTTDADVTISTSGVVYADITQSNGTYSIAYANAAALPAQTATHYYVELAAVVFTNSAIANLNQTQYGQIHIAGRFV